MSNDRSKIGRVNDFFEARLREALESCRLDAHTGGKHEEAALLERWTERLRVRARANSTYQRLELEDIIKGHKRAWPET